MKARDHWKQFQRLLGTTQDGVPGANDEAALSTLMTAAKRNQDIPEPGSTPTSINLPPGERVDDRSEKIIATLLPQLHAPARQLVRQAAAKGILIKLISGTRTYAEQQALYDQGRTKPGKIVTNAKPGSSWHNHQVAFDIGVFKNGEYLDDGPEYTTVGHIGESLGFEWGGRWTSIVDEPHFQMTNGKSLAEARTLHDQGKNVFSV